MITAIATRSRLCPNSTLISASSSSILIHHLYPECGSLNLSRKSVSRSTSRSSQRRPGPEVPTTARAAVSSETNVPTL